MIDIDLSSLGPKAAIAGSILLSLLLGGSSAVKILTQKPQQALLPIATPTLNPENLPIPTSELTKQDATTPSGAQEEIVYKYEYYDPPTNSNITTSNTASQANATSQPTTFFPTTARAPTAIVVRQPTTVPPTAVPPTPTTAQTANNGQCIVTLFGQQFNITTLVNTHSGGNVFSCGTDMTSKYHGKHGTSLNRMQQYAITNNGGNGGGGTTNPTSAPGQYNCSGKDDGWSEAQKKYCEALKEANGGD